MTKNPASVLGRLTKLLQGRDRAGNLQQHRERSQRFAIVAPLGAGAILAVQALHQVESEDFCPVEAHHRRGRSRAGLGFTGAALIAFLSLPSELPWHRRDASQSPAAPITVSAKTDTAAAAEPKRTLRPITAGMRRSAQSADRDMQLAAFSPAGVAFAKPAIPGAALEDVVIDVIVAY